MDKYQNKIKINRDNKVPYYETVVPSRISQSEVPFYYIAQEGDRLDTLSNIFYKTPNNWWVIAKANNIADGTLAVATGTSLYIPVI